MACNFKSALKLECFPNLFHNNSHLSFSTQGCLTGTTNVCLTSCAWCKSQTSSCLLQVFACSPENAILKQNGRKFTIKDARLWTTINPHSSKHIAAMTVLVQIWITEATWQNILLHHLFSTYLFQPRNHRSFTARELKGNSSVETQVSPSVLE